jgi:hypothetical protein
MLQCICSSKEYFFFFFCSNKHCCQNSFIFLTVNYVFCVNGWQIKHETVTQSKGGLRIFGSTHLCIKLSWKDPRFIGRGERSTQTAQHLKGDGVGHLGRVKRIICLIIGVRRAAHRSRCRPLVERALVCRRTASSKRVN